MLFFFFASAQSEPALIKDWKSYPLLSVIENDLLKNRYRPFLFRQNDQIAVMDQKTKISQVFPFEFYWASTADQMTMSGMKTFMKVNNGYLVGFNNGEFGGGLYWFSSDGTSRYRISNHYVNQFIWRKDTLLAIHGIVSRNIDEGTLLSLSFDNEGWHARELLNFPYAPFAIDLDRKGNLIVASRSGLMSVKRLTKISNIEVSEWLSNGYPTSLIIQNDVAYVGMTGGVFNFDLRTRKSSWLLPR
ncbi:hypothetical protein AB669_09915 [Pedobacter sp. BMA]|nr:hypothetical protein AB669_09915 [Pedobacter sp. BMA]